MTEIIMLDEVLNYIDITILDSGNREVYISNIKLIYDYFINREYLSYDKKSKLMKYCNKLLVKYIDHDNFEIKNLLIEFRNVIIDELISI